MIFQLGLLLFALAALVKTWRQYELHEVSRYWAVLFSLLWTLVLVVAAIPNLTDTIARFVGIGRGADMVVYTAIVVLTYSVLRLMIRERRLSEEMTELVRAVAMDKVHKGQDKKEG